MSGYTIESGLEIIDSYADMQRSVSVKLGSAFEMMGIHEDMGRGRCGGEYHDHGPGCPACDYGMLDVVENSEDLQCNECKRVWARRELVKLGVLPDSPRNAVPPTEGSG